MRDPKGNIVFVLFVSIVGKERGGFSLVEEPAAGVGEERKRHRRIIHELETEFWPILQGSSEGVMIFLDEEHKVASDRAAELFGFKKLDFEEMLPFFNRIIAAESQSEFESEYYEKIVAERVPTRLEFTAVRKNGEKFPARIVMVPISHSEADLVFTLSFLKEL